MNVPLRVRRLLTVLLLAAIGSAAWCADAPTGATSASVAQLYVLNVSGPTLFASNQDITDNGSALVSLPRMRYQRVEIAVGAHEFRFKDFPTGKRVARLDAEAGQTYYLVVGYSPARSWAFALAGDSMMIRLVSEAEAVQAMQEMQALP